MKNDPMERFNLFGQKAHAEKQAELAEQLMHYFDYYADPKYDIWNGGGSKAKRHHAPKDHPDYREPKPKPWGATTKKPTIFIF